jgi:ABC-2 type transport system ATP-binding protein
VNAPLQATGVGKRYGRTWALRNCSLRIPAGQVVALVGPNGAGKTTLLHLAVGLVEPSAGQIAVLGSTDRQRPDVLARLGFVAQGAPLYPTMTAAELFNMGRRLNPSWDSTGALARLREVDVPLDRPAGKLSGGQRAQVALTLALAKRPQLLLLDEPLASLDPLARRQLLQTLMSAVAETGMTVVLSSHLLADLERVCDYLIVLAAGQVQVVGEVEEVVAGHRVVRGPRRDERQIPGGWVVVDAQHSARQSTLLVRTDEQVLDPALEVCQPTLEEIVLGYLANPTVGALTGPQSGRHPVEVAP